MSAEKCFAYLALAEGYKKDNANNAIYTQRSGADPWVIPDTNGKYVDIETETDIFSGVQDLFFVFAENVRFSSWSFAADELIVDEPEPLKDIYGDRLTLGMCLNPTTTGDKYKEAVIKNFSSVTCENEMKADCVLNKSLCIQNVTENQAYVTVDFSAGKNIIQYCVDNKLRMRYHTLVWHNQTPDWFFITCCTRRKRQQRGWKVFSVSMEQIMKKYELDEQTAKEYILLSV